MESGMSDLITSGIGSYYMDSVSDTSSSTSELEKTLGSGDLSNASDDELRTLKAISSSRCSSLWRR